MSDAQDRYTIGELIDEEIITAHKDGNYGSLYPRVAEFGDEGVPFLTAKLVSDDGQIDWENAPRLNNEKADSFNYGFIKEDDVLLSHNATVGRVALVPTVEERVLVGTSLTYYRLDSSRLLPRYLATYFRGRDFQNQLASVMSHTTRNQVPITAQRKLKVVVPPMSEQRAIASILGALDDKIELNRRMNATLESIARAIFKSWFVDFAPVHVNAGLALTGQMPESGAVPTIHDPKVLELFPSTFQDSELGAIPEGWSLKPLYDTAQYVNGASFKGKDFCDAEDGLPVVKIAELKNGITGLTKYSQKEIKETQLINTGHLLYSWSGSPETSLATFVWSGGKGLLNQHIFNIITESDEQKHFVYYLLKELRDTLVGIARDKQTTGLGHVTVEDMKRLQVCVPPDDLLIACDSTLGIIYDACFANQFEATKLAALRDELLPQLLSGELALDEFAEVEQ